MNAPEPIIPELSTNPSNAPTAPNMD